MNAPRPALLRSDRPKTLRDGPLDRTRSISNCGSLRSKVMVLAIFDVAFSGSCSEGNVNRGVRIMFLSNFRLYDSELT